MGRLCKINERRKMIGKRINYRLIDMDGRDTNTGMSYTVTEETGIVVDAFTEISGNESRRMYKVEYKIGDTKFYRDIMADALIEVL